MKLGTLIGTVARKEWREMVRDGRLWLAGAATVGLLLVSLAFGWQQARAVHQERAAASETARDQWEAQGEKNPHMAGHYGMYVFKPGGALSFVDPGLEPFLGVSVKLEAHKRNPPGHAAAQDRTALQQLGGLSVAGVLQLLVPLLILGLGFGAWTAERERGTLRQLAASGVRPSALLLGKVLGLLSVLAALLVPAVALGAAVVALLGGGAVDAGRLALLLAAYLVYFGVYVAVALVVSALAPSSRLALVGLLGFWVGTAVVAPRVVAGVVDAAAPVPSAEELTRDLRKSLAEGLAGVPREERIEALSKELLRQHGFEGAEMMMPEALLQGLELQAEARFEAEVLDHHYGLLDQASERQERLLQWLAVASPTLAVRSLSMALAGTDHAHHRHFSGAAEAHRRTLLQMLDDEFATNAGDAGWDYTVGAEFWARAPAFVYAQPGAPWALEQQQVAGPVLLGWLVLGSLAAWGAARRLQVV